MIVNKPIGAVKVGNSITRLTVGKQVPKIVLDYWRSTGQLEDLKKSGAISDSNFQEKPVVKTETKKENESDSIFKNEK